MAAAISSPPYANDRVHASGIDASKFADPARAGHNNQAATMDNYGHTPGQLGAMPGGGFQAAVSSPPFGDSLESKDRSFQEKARPGRTNQYADYGPHPHNIGNDAGETFWTAARTIVSQLYQVLRPGAPAVFVVKAFVRKGQRVDFPGQWRELCEACGFETLHQHRAWLVEERGSQWDLFGGLHTKTVERKSFFRRLAERKGSPPIDWEVVLCMQKPLIDTRFRCPSCNYEGYTTELYYTEGDCPNVGNGCEWRGKLIDFGSLWQHVAG